MMTPEIVLQGLGDRYPRVREFAVRIAESFLRPASGKRPDRKFVNALLPLANDPDVRVRYQLALTLGEWDDLRAGRALAQIALKDGADPNMQTAILSSAAGRAGGILDAILAQTKNEPPPELLSRLLNLVIASHDQASAARAIEQLATPSRNTFAPWQMTTIAAFLDILEKHGGGLPQLQSAGSSALREALKKLDMLFDDARKTVEAETGNETDRLQAIRLLGRAPAMEQEDTARLAKMLRPQFSAQLQQAAFDRLKDINNPQVAGALLAGWKTYAPTLRTEVLNAVLSRTEWIRELLSLIQSGAIAPVEIAPVHQQRLLRHSERGIRSQAERLFTTRNPDREKLVESYTVVNGLSGNAEHGAALYRQNCAACHRLKGEGNNTGPDLGTVADKPVGTLLVAILDPNQAFETKYINYSAVTKSGREFSGVITAETPNSITLRSAGGADETILRNDLKELTSSKLSLMPEGFENILKPQDMADLIAYIRSR